MNNAIAVLAARFNLILSKLDNHATFKTECIQHEYRGLLSPIKIAIMIHVCQVSQSKYFHTCVSSSFIGFAYILSNEGRQFRGHGGRGRGRGRPNTKFRPDCWTEDTQYPPPPPLPITSETVSAASETAEETRNPRRKQEQNPCTWEMDYPDPSMAYDDY